MKTPPRPPEIAAAHRLFITQQRLKLSNDVNEVALQRCARRWLQSATTYFCHGSAILAAVLPMHVEHL
jgi:hypothetical protein